jgi:hypothetical protein
MLGFHCWANSRTGKPASLFACVVDAKQSLRKLSHSGRIIGPSPKVQLLKSKVVYMCKQKRRASLCSQEKESAGSNYCASSEKSDAIKRRLDLHQRRLSILTVIPACQKACLALFSDIRHPSSVTIDH